MEPVTVRKNFILRNVVFVLILVLGFGAVISTRERTAEAVEVKLYMVDAEMLRLIPVKATITKASTELMAQQVIDKLIEGRDDNPKIRRIIPKINNSMSVKLAQKTAYVDIKSEMRDEHPDGRDAELLTVYSIVNSLTCIDGIENVRFTIDGRCEKDFKGYLDMREAFIPDYYV